MVFNGDVMNVADNIFDDLTNKDEFIEYLIDYHNYIYGLTEETKKGGILCPIKELVRRFIRKLLNIRGLSRLR